MSKRCQQPMRENAILTDVLSQQTNPTLCKNCWYQDVLVVNRQYGTDFRSVMPQIYMVLMIIFMKKTLIIPAYSKVSQCYNKQ